MVVIVAVMLAMTLMNASAMAAERVALVIGNSAYRSTPELKNPRNDAEAMAAALTRLGFEVLKGIDTDQTTLRGLVRSFSREIDTAKIALFFYAGHGLQVNGKNYLIPVDAKFETESDLDFEAMDVNFVLRQMERRDRTNIVLLDACRNNPLTARLARTMGERSAFLGRGLARVETGVGTFIGFATQPDNVALDGEGDNSPFTLGLLKHIETPGLDIELMMRRVREDVIALTGGQQVPWSNSSLVGDRIVLKQAALPIDAAATPSDARPQQAPPSGDAAAERAVELAYWNSVKDSGNASYLRAYLNSYPEGSFAVLARAMLEALEKTPAQSAEPTPLPQSKPVAKLAPEAEPEPSQEPPPAIETEEPAPEPPPSIERKAPQPKPAVKAKKPAPRKAVAPERPAPKKVIRKQAPRKEAISTPKGKDCDFCFACMSESLTCRRTWVCGARYRDRLAQGLCVWRR
jgi:uncharacterized caspase-like protein